MRAAVNIEGRPVYRSEINALVFMLKSRGITICDNILSADIIFIAYYHFDDYKTIKKIVKQACLNRNQIYVLFGHILPYSGVHEECDTVFMIRPEHLNLLYKLPRYLAENCENTSLYMLAKNFFIDPEKAGESPSASFSHPVLTCSGKSRAVLNIINSDSSGKVAPVPVEVLLQHLQEVETAVIKEVYLSGENQNIYSYDDLNYNDLLRILVKESRNVRFRLGSLSPVLFDADFYELAASPRICPFFSLSVQGHNGSSDDAAAGLFSFESLAKIVKELHDIKEKVFISLDYEYGNGNDLINEFNRLFSFVQKWKIPRLYMYESEYFKKSRVKTKLEKNAGEEKPLLEKRIRKTVADNLKAYVLSLKDLNVDMIIDAGYKDGWLGILPNGLAGFAESESFYHKQGSLYYGRVFGRYADDILFVEKIQ